MAKRKMVKKVAEPTQADINLAILQGMNDLARMVKGLTEDETPATPAPPARQRQAPAAPPAEDRDETDVDAGETLVDSDLRDGRERSRKVYHLTHGALNRAHKVPDRPSSCGKVYRYLVKYDVGTTKQIAHSLMLDKKTIGNSLAELLKVGIVNAIDLPKA